MLRKLTMAEFCDLMSRHEDIKRRKKAFRQAQEKADVGEIERNRYARVGKWLKYCK